MDDEIKNKGQLKIALNILNGRQASRYSRLCSTGKPTALDRLSTATDLFDNKQVDEFAERVAAHEGFHMPPKSCKGGDCQDCKINQRTKCPHFKKSDVVTNDKLNVHTSVEKSEVTE